MHILPDWIPSWLPYYVHRHACVASGFVDADDAMSDIVYRLWQRRAEGKPQITRQLVKWMLTSQVRQAYSQRRHQWTPYDQTQSHDATDETLDTRRVLARLRTVLQDVCPRVRSLMELVVDGTTVREASLKVGLTPASGHRWYHRIVGRLRAIFHVPVESDTQSLGAVPLL